MGVRKPSRQRHRCTCAMCAAHPTSGLAKQHEAINRVMATLDEKSRRRFAGLLALQQGRGGVQAVHEVTGLSRTTIRTGRDEIQHRDRTSGIRRPGGGRKPSEKSIPSS